MRIIKISDQHKRILEEEYEEFCKNRSPDPYAIDIAQMQLEKALLKESEGILSQAYKIYCEYSDHEIAKKRIAYLKEYFPEFVQKYDLNRKLKTKTQDENWQENLSKFPILEPNAIRQETEQVLPLESSTSPKQVPLLSCPDMPFNYTITPQFDNKRDKLISINASVPEAVPPATLEVAVPSGNESFDKAMLARLRSFN